MNFKHILVGIDLMELTQGALDFISYHAQQPSNKITVINVLERYQIPPELKRIIWDPERFHAMEKEYLETAQEKLEEIVAQQALGLNVEAKAIISDLSAGEFLAEYAKENSCDLILLASGGKGVLRHMLLGSTVQKTLAVAQCPVLVIPIKN